MRDLYVGDVVQTKNGLDRGLVICNFPLMVKGPPGLNFETGKYTEDSLYGDGDVDWFPTGERMTEEEWMDKYSGEKGIRRYYADKKKQAPVGTDNHVQCWECKRNADNGGMDDDGKTMCPIQEHFRLPEDGYCHLGDRGL